MLSSDLFFREGISQRLGERKLAAGRYFPPILPSISQERIRIWFLLANFEGYWSFSRPIGLFFHSLNACIIFHLDSRSLATPSSPSSATARPRRASKSFWKSWRKTSISAREKSWKNWIWSNPSTRRPPLTVISAARALPGNSQRPLISRTSKKYFQQKLSTSFPPHQFFLA